VNSPNQESAEDYAKKLDRFISAFDIEARLENPEERLSRLKREEREHALKAWKDRVTHLVACAIALTLVIFGMFISLNPATALGDKDLAKTIITVIISAVSVYLFGRNKSTQ
jgi:hypothetical protein